MASLLIVIIKDKLCLKMEVKIKKEQPEEVIIDHLLQVEKSNIQIK
jgi:hypothetical protein